MSLDGEITGNIIAQARAATTEFKSGSRAFSLDAVHALVGAEKILSTLEAFNPDQKLKTEITEMGAVLNDLLKGGCRVQVENIIKQHGGRGIPAADTTPKR